MKELSYRQQKESKGEKASELCFVKVQIWAVIYRGKQDPCLKFVTTMKQKLLFIIIECKDRLAWIMIRVNTKLYSVSLKAKIVYLSEL